MPHRPGCDPPPLPRAPGVESTFAETGDHEGEGFTAALWSGPES